MTIRRKAVQFDPFQLDIVSNRPGGTDFLDLVPPFCPSDGAGFGVQQGSNSIDFAVVRHLDLHIGPDQVIAGFQSMQM